MREEYAVEKWASEAATALAKERHAVAERANERVAELSASLDGLAKMVAKAQGLPEGDWRWFWNNGEARLVQPEDGDGEKEED